MKGGARGVLAGELKTISAPNLVPTLLAIDPGPIKSAFALFEGLRVVKSGILDNNQLIVAIHHDGLRYADEAVLEKVECYGMAVGAEVFETVFWTGWFAAVLNYEMPVERMGRRDVKLHLCNDSRAKDANIRAALIDKFGGKEAAIGTKKQPGPLYGIKSHLWAAVALGITYIQTKQVAA